MTEPTTMTLTQRALAKVNQKLTWWYPRPDERSMFEQAKMLRDRIARRLVGDRDPESKSCFVEMCACYCGRPVMTFTAISSAYWSSGDGADFYCSECTAEYEARRTATIAAGASDPDDPFSDE